MDSDDEEESEDEEDLDHDEMILGCTTDLIISLSKATGDQFLPYLTRLGPKLYQYLGEDHPKSDKIMVIGCLTEVFNNCPSAIANYFDDFIKILIFHSNGNDASMNRNVSYSFGIMAEKASVDQFRPYLAKSLECVKKMHTASDEDDAKDNCIATITRILERHSDSFSEQERNTYFAQIMSAIPLRGDVGENETIMKFVMNKFMTD